MQVQQFYVKENYLHENYFKVKEGKMDFLETIDEDYSEANYHEAKIVEDIVKDLNEIKLNDCHSKDPIILVEGSTSNFVGLERFHWIIENYL